MQAGLQRWYSAQSQQLARLASHTAGAARLLRAAAGAEPAAEPRALLSEATSKLEAVLARVKACSEGLAAAARDSIALPGGQQFLPPGTLPVLKANDQVGLLAWEVCQRGAGILCALRLRGGAQCTCSGVVCSAVP